jgi:CO/xanthine dehydrogenase Mo-binding subunit
MSRRAGLSRRDQAAYDDAVASGAAVGLGLGLKNSGLGNGFKEIARAVVRFEDDGTVEVRHCWTEMGQGVHTVARAGRGRGARRRPRRACASSSTRPVSSARARPREAGAR